MPAVNVYLPKDRVTNAHQGYGFVEFRSEEDADYVSPGDSFCMAAMQRLRSAAGFAWAGGKLNPLPWEIRERISMGPRERCRQSPQLAALHGQLCMLGFARAWAARLAPLTEAAMHAPQAIKIMNMIKMFGKPIRVNKSSTDKKILDVGANLFVGNLDVEVDEKVSAAVRVRGCRARV